MNEFIKKIANDMLLNGKDYTSDDIYYQLKYFGVTKAVTLAPDIEKFYKEFIGSLNNSLVHYQSRDVGKDENTTHYIVFYADKKADYLEALKVYFPVKYEYMISALKTIFLYLIRNSIQASVKFHVKATNEGIVIRFYDQKDVLPFLQYCNNNFALDDLLISCNPFMATIYGIGVCRDDNTTTTYMSMLSNLLHDYFVFLKDSDVLNNASELDFLDYVMKRGNMEDEPVLKFNIRSIEHNIKAILNRENPLK